MVPLHIARLLIGSVIIGALGIYATVGLSLSNKTTSTITLSPALGTVVLNQSFEVAVLVTSDVPVNAYSGIVTFDPAVLSVSQIDYNTSIADVWIEEPWYSNGDGTVTFAGGTTATGGFTGSESLVTITFTPRSLGNAAITLTDAHLYEHDGFGTEVNLSDTIDALFTVTSLSGRARVVAQNSEDRMVRIVATSPSPDLNQDGAVTLVDISIFMLNFFSTAGRFDFNQDGTINTSDLSIILNAME